MRYRIMDILLVASPYDSFVLEEAGHMSERVLGEFRNLDLHYGPGLTTVATGGEALALAKERRFGLVISALHLADMNGAELARKIAKLGRDIPVVLLAFDARELKDFSARYDLAAVERIFLWQGDALILLAIVKSVEDRRNAEHDTKVLGVQVVILIEDNVRYYSSFLPVIYSELLHHSRRLISEGMNLSQKIMRMRARPKILLCSTYEEAWAAFTAHQTDVLGVISDIEFPSEGKLALEAGIDFARSVRALWPDVPVLLQSSKPDHRTRAADVGATFLLKGSPTLLNDLRKFMAEYFGFGDFIFRLSDGSTVERAHDLRSLEQKLETAPAESIAYHAERNHFSSWLKARTEFELAEELRPRKAEEFSGPEEIRKWLIESIASYRKRRSLGVVADFDRPTFSGWGEHDFHRIGGGSLGGKARGIAFMRLLLSQHPAGEGLDARIIVPAAVILATDVFDRFLEENALRDFAIQAEDDVEIERRFLAATFPADALLDLAAFLEKVDCPLAVRSSSLLEDSQHQSFTGVYETFMLPNRDGSPSERLERLVQSVIRVYASTFSRHAKAYIRSTPYRLEEEKMAVIVQRVVGDTHGNRFYPDFAGVARSHNFYPTTPLTAEDGIAAVALGLGRSVALEGICLRFCPRYPQHLVQFSSVKDVLANSQRSFWALDLAGDDMRESRFDLDAAEADGTLAAVGSTYSLENDAIYEGLSRPGVRLVSFAPVLKRGSFPLPEIVLRLLAMGTWGMGAPVEIEFAVAKREFAFLQLRPLALSREAEDLEVGSHSPDRILCRSSSVLGHGRVGDIHDVVVVDRHRFDRSVSQRTALEIGQFNAELAGLPYLLIGVGRWGSEDPWLGIPVGWEHISGVRVIVEAGFEDFKVTPSQGTHFFQNLTSFNVGYFTVNPDVGDGSVDWEWLGSEKAVRETSCVRHLRFDKPLVIWMNGKKSEGIILKP